MNSTTSSRLAVRAATLELAAVSNGHCALEHGHGACPLSGYPP